MPKFLEVTDKSAARAALGLPPIVHAADSIVANGSTDVSVALTALIEGLPSGSVLQLGAGDYYCPSLRNVEVDTNITIKGVPGKTRLTGNGVISSTLTTARASDVMLRVQAGASLRVEDVAVHDHGILVGFDELIEAGDIELVRCEVTDSGGLVCANGDSVSFAAGLAEEVLYTFRNLRVQDCDVRGCELGVLAWTKGGWESATVTGCNFRDVGLVGVWVGSEGYGPDREPETYQPVQSGVFVHHNTFREIRASNYSMATADQAVNAVVGMGQSVFIHDNHIEDVDNTVKWDDTEGIYVKARYFDIHNNVLINAGGSEAAIAAKGSQWFAETTLDASMNGLDLATQSTLTVASTAGFPDDEDMFTEITKAVVETSAGWQTISFTGKTATTLTGVTGGTGTLSTGGVVRGDVHSTNYPNAPSNPGRIHGNTIVFSRMDVLQRGILAAVPNLVIENNIIEGATRTAIANIIYGHGSIISGNRVLNHKGVTVFSSGARNTVWRNNTVIDHVGTYDNSLVLYTFQLANNIAERSSRDQSGVHIVNNQVYNRTNSGKIRVVRGEGVSGGSSKASNLVVAGNIARNVLRGIDIPTALSALNMVDVENDFRNDSNPQPDSFFSAGTTFAAQRIGYTVPISSLVASTTTALGVGSVELGHASDTTLSRSAAGKLAVEDVEVLLNGGALGTPASGTLTNCSGLPVAGITASISTPLGVGSIELGHASDTSITRVAAGVVAVAGARLHTRTITTLTSSATISTAAGDQVVLIGTGGLPTLGTAVGATCEVKLRNNTNAGIAIATTSSQTIDGLSSFTLPAGHAVTLIPDNGNWSVL